MSGEGKILLVIPHYRDAVRLTPFLRDLRAVLPGEFSILVSDDGSGEVDFGELIACVEAGRAVAGKAEILDPVRAVRNEGKGAAVYRGWREGMALGFDVFAFADADGAVSAAEIVRGWEYFCQRGAEGAQVTGLIGSRRQMVGRTVERKWSRHVAGRLFATMVTLIAGLEVYDTQCGFKIFRREVVEAVLPRARAFGFAFDVELLMLVARAGYRVEEFAVDWRDVDGGKVDLLRAPVPMLLEVVRARMAIRRDG